MGLEWAGPLLPGAPAGREGGDTGLDRVETGYRLEYAAWDVPVTIREPD